MSPLPIIGPHDEAHRIDCFGEQLVIHLQIGSADGTGITAGGPLGSMHVLSAAIERKGSELRFRVLLAPDGFVCPPGQGRN